MKHASTIAILVVAAAVAAPVAAEIAVFTDGRILKVDDAFIDGDRIVLLLPGSGRIEVPALRIDRVVADEVAQPTESGAPPPETECAWAFAEHDLPPGTPFADLITDAARASDLHPALLAALVRAESAFDPFAMSRVGAAGLTQLMPAAASDRGVVDVWDPADNLGGGARHLRLMLDRFDSLPLALAAYNAGARTVERHDGIPPFRETRGYVARIVGEFCGDPM